MTASTPTGPTRDRILDAAMRLFGENGFKGTSVAQIERAAGLTPGAGGLYHHFRSKDAVLAAGVQRHLARLGALRDIRRLFTGLGDPRAELVLMARYVLAELDSEGELLRILAVESRAHPDLVRGAVSALVEGTFAEFAAWLREQAAVPEERARALAAVALGALLSHRLTRALFGLEIVDDDTFVATWVGVLLPSLSP